MTQLPPQRATGFYDPRTYDREIGASQGRARRRSFYVAQTAHRGARVLELGCGTGDISLAMAEHGAHVVGLDSSPEMIRAARDKQDERGCDTIGWIQARMEAFAFQSHFTAVVVPYHTLFHVLSQSTLDALLARCLDHLELGGMFLADIFTRRPGTPTHRRTTSSSEAPEGTYHVDADEHLDPATGHLRTRFEYRLEHSGNHKILDRWTRYLRQLVTEPETLAQRLAEAGFTGATHFAAFDPGRPVVRGDDAVLRGFRPPRAREE